MTREPRDASASASEVRFPDGFVWGAATAAYQIEGAVREDGRGPSIWDTFGHTPGRVHHGDTGDVACDHYHRLDEDLELMSRLGLRAYRFSVSWPRVQPDGRGAANQAGLDFYRRLVDGLLERGIQPSPTLYHWDLPQALEDLGGWRSRDTAGRFGEYAAIVADALGDRVARWMTLNEPWVSAWLGYGAGVHAPGITDLHAGAVAHHHLLLAHGRAVRALRSRLHGAEIGIALNLHPVRPASDHADDRAAAARVDGQQNRSFLDPVLRGRYPDDVPPHSEVWADPRLCRPGDIDEISAPIDFLGVNYYTIRTVAAASRLAQARHAGLWGHAQPRTSMGVDAVDVEPFSAPRTAMPWIIEPSGLSELLLRLTRDYGPIPIHLTENGAAFDDYPGHDGRVRDPERIAYIDGHLRALREAMSSGVDVRGYFVWSLLDNFEWAFGYSKRFGIVYVDFPTLRRVPKDSFGWYRDVIARNGLAPLT